MSSRRVLVTGASSGIGRAMAFEFARRGFEVVLAARSSEVLLEMKGELERAGAPSAHVVAVDLASPEGPALLFEATEGAGLPIDYLVNNAGVGLVAPLDGAHLGPTLSMLRLNMLALTELCSLYSPRMRARGTGGILNVASMLAHLPMPGMSAYAASKSFVFALSRALREELRGTGIVVSVLCPGSVPTGFQKTAGFGAQEFGVPGELSADEVARVSVAKFLSGKATIYPGFTNRLGALLFPSLPQGWLARTAHRSLQKLGRFS